METNLGMIESVADFKARAPGARAHEELRENQGRCPCLAETTSGGVSIVDDGDAGDSPVRSPW